MRRLSADRLESVEKSLLLGQVTASAGKQPAAAPDPAEVLHAQRQQIFDAAREQGMKMLLDSAIDKARMGLTSLEVALSAAMAEEE